LFWAILGDQLTAARQLLQTSNQVAPRRRPSSNPPTAAASAPVYNLQVHTPAVRERRPHALFLYVCDKSEQEAAVSQKPKSRVLLALALQKQ
jgi:hypothetical protein